ncbi:hypothetical protein HDU76_010653, partial [Blyttiomyces sp. JEL0837]
MNQAAAQQHSMHDIAATATDKPTTNVEEQQQPSTTSATQESSISQRDPLQALVPNQQHDSVDSKNANALSKDQPTESTSISFSSLPFFSSGQLPTPHSDSEYQLNEPSAPLQSNPTTSGNSTESEHEAPKKKERRGRKRKVVTIVTPPMLKRHRMKMMAAARLNEDGHLMDQETDLHASSHTHSHSDSLEEGEGGNFTMLKKQDRTSNKTISPD